MYRFVFLVICMSNYMEASLVGSKVPLTPEDIKADEFQDIILRSEIECNLGLSSANWYELNGQITGTKQVIAGLKYEFRLPLQETDCNKQTVLENAEQNGCSYKESGTTVNCYVVFVQEADTGETTIDVTFRED
ncbi:hypothetical protein CRM22_000141 [Opisthorchis felineus]|uniref:Cystatin domain-containing protein n=1 Tax=Opisthorchis felineus TaxID=147828 RepID=A0A4S2MGG6_OPIFE|nr:hypothetical protein CRM22_000141 [Opisthorchis felineus]